MELNNQSKSKFSLSNIKEKSVGFFNKCVRVWHVLKKPTKEEFWTVAKVSALGILAIGLIGFLISLIMKLTVNR
ncbi:protein translocase SEC61 complex subunit gamma [Candidatus Pacearchaeota archaeon]|nr:protein translocase SEC61 complex subunit gamma [Candidatus Pacearchaeota archaeon]